MLEIQIMKNEKTLSASMRLAFSIALTLVVTGCFVRPIAAQKLSPQQLSRFAQQGNNDTANVMFRSGRDQISDEQWAKAEATFGQYVAKYPSEKNVDAALYWQAYSQFKLGRFDQCKATLTSLLNGKQQSTWKTEARTLWAQIPQNAGQKDKDKAKAKADKEKNDKDIDRQLGMDMDDMDVNVNVNIDTEALERMNEDIQRQVEMAQRQVEIAMPNINVAPVVVGRGRSTPDDDPCEFKIVVLQALFQSDVQRGIAAATDWLKPGSQQTVRCKSAALGLLARNGGKAVTPIILGVAQNETDMKLRARAISVLGATNDDSVIDPLRDFALNSQQSEISEAALYALSTHTGPRAITVLSEIATSNKPFQLRRVAISSIANRQGDPAVDALFKIYDSNQDLETRKVVVSGLGHRRSERAGAKLLEIARSSENIELRKAAISAISRRSGDQAVDTLLGLYDSEKNEELKDQIIFSLAFTNDPRVIDKLIEIARNPQTPIERRRHAISWLSRSKDPKVLKFLEDLLRQ